MSRENPHPEGFHHKTGQDVHFDVLSLPRIAQSRPNSSISQHTGGISPNVQQKKLLLSHHKRILDELYNHGTFWDPFGREIEEKTQIACWCMEAAILDVS